MYQPNILLETLNIKLPIIQAPMAGGPTTPELIASVSNSGGLGSLGAAYLQPEDLRQNIQTIKQLTDKPFAVNLFVPEFHQTNNAAQQKMCGILNKVATELEIVVNPIEPPYRPDFAEQFEVIIAEQVPIFSCIFGIPEKKYLQKLKASHSKIIGTATCYQDAKALQQAGVDAIVAQGLEAGGHRGTFANDPDIHAIGTMALTMQLVDLIDVPIIAAGGISDARAVKSVIDLGAQAAQVGTAFLTTPESGAAPIYKKMLLNTKHNNTQLTKAFSGRFARAIKNKYVVEMQPYENDILPFPIQNKLSKQIRTQASKLENPDFMSLWAGQNAYLCKDISAKKLMQELVSLL